LKRIFNVRHALFLILISILTVRFNLVINTIVLIFYFIKSAFSNPEQAWSRFSFDLFDCFFSTAAGLAGIIILIVSRYKDGWLKRRLSFLKRRASFTSFAAIIFLICYIFAPLITDSNPEFQKNINVTKLLPPLASVTKIVLKSSSFETEDPFMILENKVVKNSFDNNVLFADSMTNVGGFIYYQKGVGHKLETEDEKTEQSAATKTFLLGTDEFGRDIYSRLIYGSRVSLTVGLLSVLITFILGSFLGFFAGNTGGIVDLFLNRLSDLFLSFPVIFLIILILALFGNSVFAVIIVLGFSGWMSLFKIVRGEIISLKRRDYFLTAKLMGTGTLRLILYEMLPVIAVPVIVNLVFQFGNVILAESALSYLGLGTGGSMPSWGSMIESGQGYIYRAWWMILFPGLALFSSLFVTNNIGNRIKIILNPRRESD